MMHGGVVYRSMMYWGMVNRGVMQGSVMHGRMMDWGVMDGVVERRVTYPEVSLQPAALSLALSKHRLVQVVAPRCSGLGSLVPGGLGGLVHCLGVHSAHRLHPLVPKDQAGEADHHQWGQIFL